MTDPMGTYELQSLALEKAVYLSIDTMFRKAILARLQLTKVKYLDSKSLDKYE